MVVEVLVTQRDSEHPLAHQRLDLVLDQFLTAPVSEATRKAPHQIDSTIGLTQKQRARIRSDRSTIKIANNNATANGSKIKQFRVTLCRHRGNPWA